MGKKRERSVNVSGKPKHSLDVNRYGGKGKSSNMRSASKVRLLKMYKNRPIRDSEGNILKHDLQSKELPSTRIMPDRRWFVNTRVVDQNQLEYFRESCENRMSSSYNVILKQRKLPMSLLNDLQKVPKLLEIKDSRRGFASHQLSYLLHYLSSLRAQEAFGHKKPSGKEAFGHKKPSGKEGRVPRREKRRKRKR